MGIWYHATVRGDRAPIVIGNRSNVQDNSLLLGNPAKIKREVTPEEAASGLRNADLYVEEARECLGKSQAFSF